MTLVIVSLYLVACVTAQNPTIFEDGWSPVHSSQVVNLPDPGARYSLKKYFLSQMKKVKQKKF